MSETAVRQLQDDLALEPLISEHGVLELEPASDPFQRLAVSLIRQQVSMNAAAAIKQRLFNTVDVTPAGILSADNHRLEEAGLSGAKVTYLNELANAFQTHGYSYEYFDSMTNEAITAELTDIRGIGPWTAKMFLMFGLGRPDVFPVEDLGIRRGMEIVCDREMTRAEMTERAREWEPYRSYASLYLWRAYEG